MRGVKLVHHEMPPVVAAVGVGCRAQNRAQGEECTWGRCGYTRGGKVRKELGEIEGKQINLLSDVTN